MIIAYDTNTVRSKELIPFLIHFQEAFEIIIPSIVYVEMGYYFLLRNHSIEDYDEELATYNATVLLISKDHLVNVIHLAHKHRKNLPFKHHSRDYLIAGQCMGLVNVLITYNVEHFKMINVGLIRVISPEEFIVSFIPE